MHDLGGQKLDDRDSASAPSRLDKVEPKDDPTRDGELAGSWRADLARVIVAEIVPRLLLAREAESRGRARRPAPIVAFDPLDVTKFAGWLLGDDDERSWEFVSALARRGRPSLSLLVDLLAPAARHVGRLWETDDCDFVDVTIGLRRLTQILYRLIPEEGEDADAHSDSPRMLLLPTPGESHVFGVAVVEAFFRAEGWRVSRGGTDFASALRRDRFDIVGFSLSGVRHVETLTTAVREARSASSNPHIGVLVGGPIFASDDGLAARVGADAAPADVPGAVQLAMDLLRRRARM